MNLKFKQLEWEFRKEALPSPEWSATVFDGQFMCVIIFFEDGVWNIHSENRDPSQWMQEKPTLTEAKEWVQQQHEGMIKTIFDIQEVLEQEGSND